MINLNERSISWIIHHSRWLASMINSEETDFLISNQIYSSEIEENLIENLFKIETVKMVEKTINGIKVTKI